MQRRLTKIFSVSKSHDSLSTNTDRVHETVSMIKKKFGVDEAMGVSSLEAMRERHGLRSRLKHLDFI